MLPHAHELVGAKDVLSGALEVAQVVGVIDDAGEVGVLVIHLHIKHVGHGFIVPMHGAAVIP